MPPRVPVHRLRGAYDGYRNNMNKKLSPPHFDQGEHRIILASGSPRRRELCAAMGLDFIVKTSDVDESIPEGMPPDKAVAMLSRRKAESIGSEDAIVIAADTVVAFGKEILGKPEDEAHARRMLTMLSGRTHAVYTGVTVAYRGRYLTSAEETVVRFRRLSDDEITTYVATNEPMDKAGAYGIQGLGGALVEAIEGEFDNVVGLPCCLLYSMLTEMVK